MESADILEPEQRRHLDGCPSCRAEVESFQEIGALVRGAEVRTAVDPAPDLWRRISTDLASPDPTASTDAGAQSTDSSSPTPIRARRTRRRWSVALVAAAIGLIVGVGGVVAAQQVLDRREVLATTTLEALPGHSGTGTAQLLRHHGVTELRIRIQASTPPQDYRELWLINVDGRRMYSLGVLPTSGEWTYLVPPQLGRPGRLHHRRRLDRTVRRAGRHSTNSLVRGSLPV